MKKELIFGFLFATLLIMINSIDAKVLDCGNDYDCFLNASINCEKSKVEIIDSQQAEFITFDIVTQMRIKGMKKESCIFSVKTKKVNLEINETLLDEFILNNTKLNLTIEDKKEIKKIVKKINDQIKQSKDIAGTCKLPPNSLTDLLNTWDFGFFSNRTTEQIEGCKGRFFKF